MNSLSELSRTWQLGISKEKCCVFHIHFCHENFLRTDGQLLKTDVSSVRDLGVHLGSDLQWFFHCSVICAKVRRVANCVLRSLKFGSVAHSRTAFVDALFRGILPELLLGDAL